MKFRLLAIFLGVISVLGGGAQAARPKLEGCFYNYASRLGWTEQQWADEMDWLAELGLKTLIITTAVHEQQAYYPSRVAGLNVMDTDSLEMVFNQADRAGMEILLMPYDTTAYWVRSDAAFYDGLTSITCQVTRDTYELYGHHPSLKGYYYAPEFWSPSPQMLQEVWAGHFIRPVAACVKGLNPQLLVTCAPFVGSTPGDYDRAAAQAFWSRILEGNPGLDVVMLQDGIGAFEHTPPETATDEAAFLKARGRTYQYLDTLYADAQARSTAAGKTLWSDLEAFENVGMGYPPHISRIVHQLAAAAPRVQKTVAFEGLYLSLTTSVSSVEFDENYRRYLSGRPFAENIAKGCAYTCSGTLGAGFPDDGLKLTDGGQDGYSPAHFMGWAAGSAAGATIDLGVESSEIFMLAGAFKDEPGAGIVRPERVSVSISNDASTFTPLGEMQPLDPAQRNASCVYRLKLTAPASGRYVRFAVPAAPGVQTVCGELAAFSPAPQWLSKGKPYSVINMTPSTQFPDEGGELTDGNFAPRWYAQTGWNRPAKPVKIVLDLQEICDVALVRASFMARGESWLQLPAQVRARFSLDGAGYGAPVALQKQSRPAQQFHAVTAAKARFVELEVTGAPESWVLMSELSVLGRPDPDATVPVQLGQLELGQNTKDTAGKELALAAPKE